MATVTVQLPPLLTHPELFAEDIERAATVGMQDELEIIVGEIKASLLMPVDKGVLRRSIEALPVRRDGANLVSAIISAGEASQYAAVMDLGRRAGKRAPPIPALKAWVKRKLPDAVREVAAELQAAYVAAHPTSYTNTSGKKISRSVKRFEERAIFLLAAAISRSIRLRGIEAHRFVDGRTEEIGLRVRMSVTREIDAVIARLGAP